MAWLSNQFPPLSSPDSAPLVNLPCVVVFLHVDGTVEYRMAFWNDADQLFRLQDIHPAFGQHVSLSMIEGYQRLSEFKLVK